MALLDLNYISISSQQWGHYGASYTGKTTYGLQEALSIDGLSFISFSGLFRVSDIVRWKGNYSYEADAYSPTSYDQSQYLDVSNSALIFNDACPQSNCTAACSGNFSSMFEHGGLQTIHNCLLTPNLAVANRTSTYVDILETMFTLGNELNVTAGNVMYQLNSMPFFHSRWDVGLILEFRVLCKHL